MPRDGCDTQFLSKFISIYDTENRHNPYQYFDEVLNRYSSKKKIGLQNFA